MTVLVRDPVRLPPELQPAQVVVGDVLNRADVDGAVSGQDAVIIILGTRNDLSRSGGTSSPPSPCSEAFGSHEFPSLPLRSHHNDVRRHPEHRGIHEVLRHPQSGGLSLR